MIITIRITQQGHKPKTVTTPVSPNLTMAQIKLLWETEQLLNNLPGANLRVHIDIHEGDGN